MATTREKTLVLRQKDCKLIAQFLAMHGVRNNTELEDLHGGITPSSKTGDYMDVYVVSPYGKIPWNELYRISDKEMRSLMLSIEAALTGALRSLTVFKEQHLKVLPDFVKQSRTYDDPYMTEFLKVKKIKKTLDKIVSISSLVLTLYLP